MRINAYREDKLTYDQYLRNEVQVFVRNSREEGQETVGFGFVVGERNGELTSMNLTGKFVDNLDSIFQKFDTFYTIALEYK